MEKKKLNKLWVGCRDDSSNPTHTSVKVMELPQSDCDVLLKLCDALPVMGNLTKQLILDIAESSDSTGTVAKAIAIEDVLQKFHSKED